ncbi:MAG: biotin carboxylase N-terminal domain-containing protein, partial [Dehalococcoidia bacterium]
MKLRKILIANRGEIAIRVARAASDLGIQTITIYSQDDAKSLHVLSGDKSYALKGAGAGAYLDKPQLISLALDSGCDAVHPGYGFLSENAGFAQLCAQANLTFIGPPAETLRLFGDKARTRNLAEECSVPVMPGSVGPVTLKEASAFFTSLGDDAAVVVKAVKGGGGRGIRPVHRLDDLEEAYNRCQSEAETAFGARDVYIEQLMPRARHIEVQVIGDGKQVIHLGERECTLQRRGQKLIEVAPSPSISTKLRAALTEAALRMARHVNYISLGTFEFLIDRSSGGKPFFAFLETNPRLQVEHTVTEEVTGIDIVRAQIEIAGGKTLLDLGLVHDARHPRIYSVQARVNLEHIDETGNVIPSTGRISVYEAPSGPGIRVDGYGYSGYTTNPAFDSLLAKLIITSRSDKYQDAVTRIRRTLREFRIEGVETNISFLINLLSRQEVENNDIHTRFIEDNAATLASTPDKWKERFFSGGRSVPSNEAELEQRPAPPGTIPLKAPMQGCVVDIEVIEGDAITAGQKLVVLESMKMEHVITAVCSGYVRAICVTVNENVQVGSPLHG